MTHFGESLDGENFEKWFIFELEVYRVRAFKIFGREKIKNMWGFFLLKCETNKKLSCSSVFFFKLNTDIYLKNQNSNIKTGTSTAFLSLMVDNDSQ